MKILNLTQHLATKEQVAQGVINLEGKDLEIIKNMLTFTTLPTKEELNDRANLIVLIVSKYDVEACMLGGAPYFMGKLERKLKNFGYRTLYAYSERVSVEEMLPDGDVVKHNVFRHMGFVEV